MSAAAASPPCCTLKHPLFATLDNVCFRRSETGDLPVMSMLLGERWAALPLAALQAELAIAPDSPDGRMLALVAEALDFVTILRPGEALPAEVITGDASWSPDGLHFQLAAARVKLQLTAWIADDPDTEALSPDRLLMRVEEPATRQRLQEAVVRAAVVMDLPGPDSVLALIEELAAELAFIEALRDRLLRPVAALARRIGGIAVRRLDPTHQEAVTQVQRLLAIGLREIRSRFDELDAQTGEVMAALRNIAHQKRFIRGQRDWLFRSQRAWTTTLADWGSASNDTVDQLWARIDRTYHFLAPRFMPVTEWQSHFRPARNPQRSQMTW